MWNLWAITGHNSCVICWKSSTSVVKFLQVNAHVWYFMSNYRTQLVCYLLKVINISILRIFSTACVSCCTKVFSKQCVMLRIVLNILFIYRVIKKCLCSSYESSKTAFFESLWVVEKCPASVSYMYQLLTYILQVVSILIQIEF